MALYPDVTGAVAIVAGTGGIVVSFREALHKETGAQLGLEQLGRCGGWGWILGDEGGGYHVGREAVRQVLDEADRASVDPKAAEVSCSPRPHNLNRSAGTAWQTVGSSNKPWGLRQRILDRFGVTDVYELLTVVHKPDPVTVPQEATAPVNPDATLALPPSPQTAPPPADKEAGIPASAMVREKRLSSLSPLVFTAAFEDGDPLAMNVLKTTSSTLVDQICVLLRDEQEAAAEGERRIKAAESILCMGGSLSAVDAYRKLIVDELARRGHVFRRVEVVDDAAAVGAKALTVLRA